MTPTWDFCHWLSVSRRATVGVEGLVRSGRSGSVVLSLDAGQGSDPGEEGDRVAGRGAERR